MLKGRQRSVSRPILQSRVGRGPDSVAEAAANGTESVSVLRTIVPEVRPSPSFGAVSAGADRAYRRRGRRTSLSVRHRDQFEVGPGAVRELTRCQFWTLDPDLVVIKT
ncbi:hypothetical protein EVAR_39605_1 [Eumeta japonica]|uniref:Uncharacterized protein n=1 Tax=Eumeta variegata TaxID=151549 RepID=A0A4C1Y5B4_EUMVA|nr:hypothetical protein EVAR_39605_1 [Eumeta japonica]